MRKRAGWVKNGIGYIPLTKGLVAKVDVHRLEELTKHNWAPVWNVATKSYSAVTNVRRTDGPGYTGLKMHRAVAGVTDPKIDVDHRNHDTLDNRLSNLRPCLHMKNMLNMRHRINGSTGYKGVTFHKRSGEYRAQLTVNGKRLIEDGFKTARAAAKRYAVLAVEHYGEFAYDYQPVRRQ